MIKRHVNIPIFIPHLGCPNDCVFCNQRIISGVSEFNPESVIPIIELALSTTDASDDIEIAFFGGSFTGIDVGLMKELLKIANSYLIQGRISSIRCSTRPDYINEEVLNILKQYGVTTIELGLQSVSDDVLRISKRGHDFADEKEAVGKIKNFGFRLGGQMMIGLPGSKIEDEIKTATFIVESGADEARIYPTVVFKGTELCEMTKNADYTPLTLEEAVERSSKVFEIMVNAGVKVLRIGLCDSENLHNDTTYYSGPNHAAIGEMVESEYYYSMISKMLSSSDYNGKASLTLTVAKGHTSKVIGQRRKNKIRLFTEYGFNTVRVIESESVTPYKVVIGEEERK